MTRLHAGCTGTGRSILITLVSLLWLAACGGGGGTDAVTNPDIGAPDPATAPGPGSPIGCDTHGIEGGGRHKLAGVVSEIGADEHLSVGNVRFAAGAAKVYVDGVIASVASLRAGDVASVTGTFDLNTQTGCASAISADAAIVAAIDTVDPALGTLTMLGQEVHIDEDTVFGSDVQPRQLSSLQPGDIIRLSGLYKDVGVIAATRIDRAAGHYVVTGVVTQLDTQNMSFRVNDSILVDYAAAGLIDFPTGLPRDGDPVRVTGTAFDAGGSAQPGSVVLRPAFVWYSQNGTTFTVFPAEWSMLRGEMAQFTASSGPGSVTWSITHSDGRPCTLEECGVINPTTGAYNGSKFGDDTTFLVIATSIIDPTDRVAVPLYVSNLWPIFSTGPNTVEGDVFAFETGPIPGGEIHMWVRTADWAFSWFNVWPDELGHFVAAHMPDSLIHVTAADEGYVQPCAVRADVRGDVSVQVEMMPVSSLDTFDAPRPQLSLDPTLSGMIYETTPGGRQPVPGAEIGIHLDMWDNVIAYTMSDRGGGYFLCNLGPRSDIVVWKRGYSQKLFVQLDTSQSRVLDIELERN